MRFWLSVVAVQEVDQFAEIARFAESVGFHGLMVGDHLLWPNQITSRYPYTPDGKIFVPPTTPWPDPWVLFAYLGAVTKKLHFASNIYLAGVRDPFTFAKGVATATSLIGDRIICGVSAGWLKEEYEQAGVDFESRGRRLDEVIAAARKLWTGAPVKHDGELFHFDAIQCPQPAAPPKIWCGGDAPAALRRAARNDGWLPLPMTVEQTKNALAKIRALRAADGRDMQDFRVGLPLAQPTTQAAVDELRGLGLGDLTVIAPWLPSPWDIQSWLDPGDDMSSLDVKKKALQRYAEAVIQRVR